MESRLYENLLSKLYYIDDLSLVKKAYKYALFFHQNQYRDSGEAYIVHPLSVALILADMHADSDTICAALLHDTLEDTSYTINDLQNDFGNSISLLVTGVTNMPKSVFSTKEEQILYNQNHFITSSLSDARIIILKLSDRLHNMRTIGVKSRKSIISNSCETMFFYVSFARYLKIKYLEKELEDLSFKYLYSNLYYEIFDERKNLLKKCDINKTVNYIRNLFISDGIDAFVSVDIRNIYGLYQDMKMNTQTNLFNINVVVEDNDNVLRYCFNDVNVYSPNEFLENKYGVASNWFNNKSIQDSFLVSDLYTKLQRVKSSYDEIFDLNINKVKCISR